MQASDEQLMLRTKEGDKASFAELVRRYQRSLFNFIWKFVGNRETAADLFQETFIRILKSAPRYQPTAKFSTYAYKIATNLCINEMKRLRNLDVSLDAPIGAGERQGISYKDLVRDGKETPVEHLVRQERINQVRQALDSLKPNQRAILMMVEYQELSYDEVSGIMNCSLGTVKSRVHRARQAVKQYLNQHGWGVNS